LANLFNVGWFIFYFMMFVVKIMIFFLPARLFWDFFGSGWKIKVIPGLTLYTSFKIEGNFFFNFKFSLKNALSSNFPEQ